MQDDEIEDIAEDWDTYLLQLEDYTLMSVPDCTMFEHIFHIIHHLVVPTPSSAYLHKHRDLVGAFTKDLDSAAGSGSFDNPLNLKANPANFMSKMFLPVAKALDRIFNWRDLPGTGPPDSDARSACNPCFTPECY